MLTLTTRILNYASAGYGLRESVERAQRDAADDERVIARTKRLLSCYRYTPAVQSKQKSRKECQ